MNQKGFINILLIVVVVALIGAGVYFVSTKQITPPTPSPILGAPTSGPITVSGEITCLPKTGQGAQTLECAIGLRGTDGRYYGLKNLFKLDPEYKFSATGLRVEVSGSFNPEETKGPDRNKYDVVGIIDVTSIRQITSPTPPSSSNWVPYIKEGTCPPGYVDYGPPLQCVTPEYMEYCKRHPCPICLAGNSLIDTPSGLVPVKDLQVGMLVWTTDKTGQRVSGVITKTSRVLVPPTHRMVHLVLNDGRELFVSPGHPTIDGRTVGNLASGDLYDGVSVISTKRVSYGESATYDILPSGETGFYWANGILLDSTLR